MKVKCSLHINISTKEADLEHHDLDHIDFSRNVFKPVGDTIISFYQDMSLAKVPTSQYNWKLTLQSG